ncbi:MAG TPA: MauE/DoxX family redox-associated membrane protein [Acidimicrobiia bacterium]|nr:MauE/DoxX family redox-associated membrane protein [Acidimicrobiia bacterium]
MGPTGPALALACRIVLAAVLVIAAVGKIADHAQLPARLQEAGVGARGARMLAIGLPATELVVAIALLLDFHSPIPGIAAIVLLLAFSVFLVRTARRAVPCPCFGAVRTGARTTAAAAVVRNGVLVALAVLATGTAERARLLGTTVDFVVVAAVAGLAIARVA